jgi:hypothetical protein
MIRVTKMGNKWYGLNLSEDNESEMDEIISLAEQGVPSIIVDDISELEDLGIYVDVEMVDRDNAL